MALKLYPLGLQTFERIRKEDKLYIDKTEYVYRLTHTSGTYFFLRRPRRFGKSLFLTTLQSYFEGKKDLFKGLAIEKLEKEWTEYPVLHFDLSGGKHMDKQQLERYLAFILETEEKKWGVTQPQIDANNRLTELINTAYEKSGRQVVVLIDEYDSPMLDVAHEQEQLDALRNIMRNFFSPLKYSEAKLRFVFLTGITKFSQLSIFSELNNISNISMKDDYAGICGITETELLDDMQDGIAGLAQANELTPQQVVAKLKENYDGYHFSAHSPGVFNPFSLLSSLANKDFDSYWFASGTPTYLVNMLQRFNVQPASLQRMCAKSSAFDSPTETMKTITPLLYQSGYLTIKKYDPIFKEYTLGIPNKEVRDGLLFSMVPHYLNPRRTDNDAFLLGFCKAVFRGDIDKALECMRIYMATIPYDLENHTEKHFQTIFYLMFSFLNIYIKTEVKSAVGRADAVMYMPDTVYVFELKVDKSADEALRQIDERGYMIPYQSSGRHLVKIGISFDSKTRTISDWKICK